MIGLPNFSFVFTPYVEITPRVRFATLRISALRPSPSLASDDRSVPPRSTDGGEVTVAVGR